MQTNWTDKYADRHTSYERLHNSSASQSVSESRDHLFRRRLAFPRSIPDSRDQRSLQSGFRYSVEQNLFSMVLPKAMLHCANG